MVNKSDGSENVAQEAVAIKAMQGILTVVEISLEDESRINGLLLSMAEEIGPRLQAKRRRSELFR